MAYEGLEAIFPKEKIRLTGNPIRQDLTENFIESSAAKKQLGLSTTKPCLMVLGGSLGSRRINQLIEGNLHFFKEHGVELFWQCGAFYHEEYEIHNSKERVIVTAFIDDMKQAYAAADIIISRSGAISVSELCVVAKPVIFIPSPNVAEDHQTKNAQAIASKDAALCIAESDLEEQFQSEFLSVLNSRKLRERLSTNIQQLAKVEATQDIVNEIEKLIR